MNLAEIVSRQKATYSGMTPRLVEVEAGSSLYLPSEWTAVAVAAGETVYITEMTFHPRNLEDLAVNKFPFLPS